MPPPSLLVQTAFARITALAGLVDGANTALFTLEVPGNTAYSFSAAQPVEILAAAAQSIVGANIQTRLTVANPLPASAVYLSSSTGTAGPNTANPLPAVMILNGFIYNVSSAPITITFTIAVNVTAGVSSIEYPVNVYFHEVPVAGFSV